MTAEQFAAYCRRLRETNSPAALAQIREELDREHGNEPDTPPLRFMATTKRVRILDSN
jgi:hypothetical protein